MAEHRPDLLALEEGVHLWQLGAVLEEQLDDSVVANDRRRLDDVVDGAHDGDRSWWLLLA